MDFLLKLKVMSKTNDVMPLVNAYGLAQHRLHSVIFACKIASRDLTFKAYQNLHLISMNNVPDRVQILQFIWIVSVTWFLILVILRFN